MRKVILCAVLGLGVFLLSGTVYAEVPHEIGGFVLGAKLADFKDRLEMKTALPIRYQEYLTEVQAQVPEGFKSGLITFGTCTKPERIAKISFKYDDSSKAFFDKLLAHFKARFGNPTQWRGDPFHIYLAWKWSFVDKQHHRISMILQHYEGDEDIYKNGNSVKLSMTSLLEKEGRCYAERHPEAAAQNGQQSQKGKQKVNFDTLIPK